MLFADNFKELIALRRQHPDFKVILSVGGWTLSSQFPPMASSAESRRAFVASCVTNLRQWGLDGLDLDWEYPTAAEKTNFAALITELRAAFDEESARTGRVRLTLGAAVAAVSTKGYDITTMAENLDLVNVMTYNFHGSQRRPKLTGHSSPLYPSNSDRPHYSTSGAMEAWANLGIPKSKLLVGLSFYGNTWSLTNASDHGLGAAANGPAPAGPITRKAGVLAYNEICGLVQSGQLKRVMDAKSCAPYALGGTTWVSYDDTESIRGKAKWIMTNDFAGAFVWEISFDDFAGQCGSSKALLTALKDGLGQSANHINPSAATHTQ
ncbi:Acidic mammalian chitinase [Hypsibius exemplaris]|uniref:Acidic mammalian chitinase n=1 Tax=Hypsibius exemplaris TaxID=2072580 RepID=A0A1W0WCF0_HYPEX|nr:Acidic mammalian chitinase [Hypsibius exemplaris]